MRERSGFSLIEIAVVVGIMVIIAGFSLANLGSRRTRVELTGATKQIAGLLREAQSRSAAQVSSSSWGVRLANVTNTAPFYALFSGSYATTSRIGYYHLPPSVRYATATIPQGGFLYVVFSQIAGIPSTATSVVLELTSSSTSAPYASTTITINPAGSVSY